MFSKLLTPRTTKALVSARQISATTTTQSRTHNPMQYTNNISSFVNELFKNSHGLLINDETKELVKTALENKEKENTTFKNGMASWDCYETSQLVRNARYLALTQVNSLLHTGTEKTPEILLSEQQLFAKKVVDLVFKKSVETAKQNAEIRPSQEFIDDLCKNHANSVAKDRGSWEIGA